MSEGEGEDREVAEREGNEGEGESREALEAQEIPMDISDQLRIEHLKTVLEASRFSEMEYICGQIAADKRMPESVKANLISLIMSSAGRSPALSYYNTEEDRKVIISLVSLNEQLFWHTGYRIDKNRKNNFFVGMARYGAEVQTRKGRGAHGSRLLATTIVRQEQGIAPNDREMQSGKKGWFAGLLGK